MNEIEKFFDKQASTWDDFDDHSIDDKLKLLNKIGIKQGDKVLDVACGTGVITGLLYQLSKKDVLGIDLSNEMIKIAKNKYSGDKHISFKHQDLLTMNEDDLFDVVVIYNAYPHFLSPNELSNKLYKLLKKDGKVAILHSLSREKLIKHHSDKAKNVSRELLSPEEEYESFKDGFDLLVAEEDDQSYTLILKRK